MVGGGSRLVVGWWVTGRVLECVTGWIRLVAGWLLRWVSGYVGG